MQLSYFFLCVLLRVVNVGKNFYQWRLSPDLRAALPTATPLQQGGYSEL